MDLARPTRALLALIGTTLLLPAPAQAAQSFGADLSQNPVNSCAVACTLVTLTRSTGAAEAGSPSTGVLTEVRIKYVGNGGDGRFAVLRGSGFSYFNVGPDLPFSVPATGTAQIFAFAVRRPISAGDRLGLIVTPSLSSAPPGPPGSNPDLYEAGGAPRNLAIASGEHPPNTTRPYVNGNSFEVLVNGTVETDADGDGFGDDTQDCAPTNAAVQCQRASDTAPPQTTITKSPPNRDEASRVTYRFKSSESGSTFRCKLDGKAFKGCRSPRKLSVDQGKHKFKVIAVDPAGNADPSPAKDRFRVTD